MDPIGVVDSKAFASLWKCLAPSKVKAFAWQLLLDRIPTRQILISEGDQFVCGVERQLNLLSTSFYIVILQDKFG
jgi:hypothetical protein